MGFRAPVRDIAFALNEVAGPNQLLLAEVALLGIQVHGGAGHIRKRVLRNAKAARTAASFHDEAYARGKLALARFFATGGIRWPLRVLHIAPADNCARKPKAIRCA